MKKFIQFAKDLWLRVWALVAPVFGATRACFAKVCTFGRGTGACASGACEVGRAAAAGAILFGIAGAGMGASGGISAYGVASSAAGATVAVGWGPYWLLWTVLGMVTGAAVGAASVYFARFFYRERGAAAALLVVGALGGVFTGASWGTAVARERVVEVRAQVASAKQLPAGQGAQLSVVNGPVRLTGSVARDVNGLLLTFMLVSGAVVGILAARGLSVPTKIDGAAQPTGESTGQPSFNKKR